MTVVEQNGPAIEIRLLGAVQAYCEGRPIELGGRQARSILAVLLLHPGQTVPKQRLIDYAWHGDPPPTAEDLVAAYLSRLRKALNNGAERVALLSARPGFRAEFDPDLVDAHRFSALARLSQREHDAREDELAALHLQSALDLWHGNSTALSDLESAWLRAQARVFETRRLEALELLARLHLDADRPAQAVALLQDVVPAHPERESLTVTLVEALASSGEAVQAAQAAANAATALIELGQVPGPALRSAQTAALSRRPDKPATQPGPRHQLPADTRAFTGRTGELARLLDATAASLREQDLGKPVICTIDGMAGIGKSALAVHLAHRLAEGYPDGQLFIDLHGYTQGYAPRTAGYALETFLRALGTPPQQIPQDLDERAAFYRERLAATRTLILLDNADSEAQVRPLLPGTAGCLVLITSRKKLKALDDAYSLSLDPLPPADAIALFCTAAGTGRVIASDPALEEIVALCGQLPLAVRIAAALLRHRPTWSLGHLAGLLRDRYHRIATLTDGDRDLAAVFNLSYGALGAAQQQLFHCLGLVPGPDVDAYAAAALIDADLRTATRRLEDLVDHNLLSQLVPERYQLHDLIRIHARACAEDDSADARDAALDRLFDYYLSTAQAANRHLARRTTSYTVSIDYPPRSQPVLTNRAQAAAWMRADLANLAASVDFAATHDRPNHTVAIAAAMHGHLYIDGPWTYALALHAAAAETALRQGDQLGRATALHGLGRMRRMIGDYSGAAAAHQQALELYSRLDHRLGQANALDSLGRVQWLTGDYPGAAEILGKALRLFGEVGDPLGQAGALNGLGRVWRLTGKYAKAIEAHSRAFELCCRAGDRIGQATALNDLGRTLCQTGDLTGATQAQDRALGLYVGAGHRLGQANALNELGRVRFRTGDYFGAIEAHERALKLYREMGHRLGQAGALNDLGRARCWSADYSGAAGVIESALRLFREVGDRQGEAESLNRRAVVFTATGASRQARVLHRAALQLAGEIGSPLDEAEALEGLGESFRSEGRGEDGVGCMRQALAIYQRLGVPEAELVSARLADIDRDDW